MAALKIIGLCILASVLYGIVHDQVTARVCVEYFTIGHPQILATESPTILALAWGVIATWWVGLVLGAPLAFAAIRGRQPRRTGRSLVQPIGVLLLCMLGVSLVAGLIGYALASNGIVVLVEPLSSRVPGDRHVAFIAVGWAHGASYVAGLVGGFVLIRSVWKQRQAASTVPPNQPMQRAALRAAAERQGR